MTPQNKQQKEPKSLTAVLGRIVTTFSRLLTWQVWLVAGASFLLFRRYQHHDDKMSVIDLCWVVAVYIGFIVLSRASKWYKQHKKEKSEAQAQSSASVEPKPALAVRIGNWLQQKFGGWFVTEEAVLQDPAHQTYLSVKTALVVMCMTAAVSAAIMFGIVELTVTASAADVPKQAKQLANSLRSNAINAEERIQDLKTVGPEYAQLIAYTRTLRESASILEQNFAKSEAVQTYQFTPTDNLGGEQVRVLRKVHKLIDTNRDGICSKTELAQVSQGLWNNLKEQGLYPVHFMQSLKK